MSYSFVHFSSPCSPLLLPLKHWEGWVGKEKMPFDLAGTVWYSVLPIKCLLFIGPQLFTLFILGPFCGFYGDIFARELIIAWFLGSLDEIFDRFYHHVWIPHNMYHRTNMTAGTINIDWTKSSWCLVLYIPFGNYDTSQWSCLLW